jgi:hypothetical protein
MLTGIQTIERGQYGVWAATLTCPSYAIVARSK